MEVEIIEHDELEIDMGDGTFVLDNDYKNIKNKPKINGVELDGNKTLEELGIQAAEDGKGLSEKNFTAEYEEKLKELKNYDDTGIKKSIEDLDKNKVDKEKGKGLSTNDFTNAYKEKLDKLSNYDDTEIKKDIGNKVDKVEGKGLSTEDFTTELKTKLEGLSNYDDTKIKQDIGNKVDKEEGKGLSTNDFDNDYKEKLDKLENYDDKAITDALTKANNKIAELEQTVALQDEQIPRRNRRRRKHYISG